ncbi:protein IQ-DOMAIN 14-like [Phoenix dactylifera]|uniref:Protein IQ-DOMAIN 14-like n=1 Tax=Phoenix dactylifera TaxID=42345 RepID=A0A8B7BZ00_PHODC|nr:protein IQ-DOMAIN 14-like [Phoenix dactylifera]XP_008788230.1 protein IQ-DOMAIN 14-like [Phoenix dactylifera]
MGKKGNWFTALKRAFTSSSKDTDKPIDVSEKKNIKEKKRWGFGRSKHGEVNSFIPLFRKPSSIEQILCDAERDQLHRTQQAPQKKVLPLKSTAPAPAHLLAPAPKPLITPNYVQMSAVKIQAAYRGYLARRNYRALKGLIRLQGVMRGQSVKRQTMNAMKCMQMLVRVQSQIRARRLQMMESRSIQQHHTPRKSDKEFESSFGKWSMTHRSEAEAHGEWNDSVLTKGEVDARMRRKVEAVIKRERALAYAYSHQLLNVSPKSAHAVLTDIRMGGFPWWWNYLERRLSGDPRPQTPASRLNPIAFTPFTPCTPSSSSSAHPHPRPFSRGTPRPASASKLKPSFSTSSRRSDHHPSAAAAAALRDDESLTSCSAFTLPNYMTPTASAKAKSRALATDHEGKPRFSFRFGQSIGSLQGSLFAATKDAGSQRMGSGKHKKTLSVGGLSVDSTVSMPAGVGRRPFK